LVQRFAIVVDVWLYKKQHSISALDTVRRDRLLQLRILQGKKKWLSEDFIVDVRKRIHEESLDIQK
jgi:chorismate mutase